MCDTPKPLKGGSKTMRHAVQKTRSRNQFKNRASRAAKINFALPRRGGIRL